MNIAFFGGTFDPVHRGHIQIAHSAVKRFDIGQVLFVPANIQPLKQDQRFAPYHHRAAMLALAEDLRPRKDVLNISRKHALDFSRQPVQTMALAGATLHLMGDISEKVSATQIRAAAKSTGKAKLRSLVGEAVAEYIQKTGIY